MDPKKIEVYLEVLACPECKGELEYKNPGEQGLEGFFCKKCKLLYPIVEEIPLMMVEDAVKITNESS